MIENLENEVWRDVYEFEGIYKVSNKGRVKRLYKRGERILIPFTAKKSLSVTFINKCRKKMLLAKVVAIAFLGVDPKTEVFNYRLKDGDVNNCSADNIYIVKDEPREFATISDEQKGEIMEWFWTKHDNRDSTIGKHFGIDSRIISKYIYSELDKKYKNFKQ